jgi:hypothetical protein
MTVQVTMTVTEQSEDENPAPKVTNYLVEFPSVDVFLDMLSDMGAPHGSNITVLKLNGEELFPKD